MLLVNANYTTQNRTLLPVDIANLWTWLQFRLQSFGEGFGCDRVVNELLDEFLDVVHRLRIGGVVSLRQLDQSHQKVFAFLNGRLVFGREARYLPAAATTATRITATGWLRGRAQPLHRRHLLRWRRGRTRYRIRNPARTRRSLLKFGIVILIWHWKDHITVYVYKMTPIYLQLIYGSQEECGESPVGLVDSTEKKFRKFIFKDGKTVCWGWIWWDWMFSDLMCLEWSSWTVEWTVPLLIAGLLM